MDEGARYDRIGHRYARGRRPDPRLAGLVVGALGPARTVVNVGAGTGNYEPAGREVVAVEPSSVMIAQRPPGSAPAVLGAAEALPVGDDRFEASLALSTIHHWDDVDAGLAEMARVAPRRVVYCSEPIHPGRFWLADDYFPSMLTLAVNTDVPTAVQVGERLGGDVTITAFPLPADFAEGSGGAYWSRPEAYCDPGVQAAISLFALLPVGEVAEGTRRLRADLASGAWDRRHGHLRTQPSFDLGYRIVVSTR